MVTVRVSIARRGLPSSFDFFDVGSVTQEDTQTGWVTAIPLGFPLSKVETEESIRLATSTDDLVNGLADKLHRMGDDVVDRILTTDPFSLYCGVRGKELANRVDHYSASFQNCGPPFIAMFGGAFSASIALQV
ncbi:hypothetical protein [Ralstonia sp. ASV6]|uniref:hypothetical protein n=1 Tax=Ralstonia sp. ASV6 TaxID=2795124 RepID=UPI0018EBCD91|nr:hypothetical protein [Ralstonia sp. ASV6]